MFLRLYSFIFSVCMLLFNTMASAQDNSNLTHYFMNPYSINPSYAGTDGKSSVFLTYRKQWVDIEGAPVISNFSFHAPAGKKMGFGINVTNAQRSVLNTTSAFLTASYGISLSKDALLRFGLSGGAAYNGADIAEIENIADPELQSLLDNNIYLIGNAGISLQVKTFNFGISIPNIFMDDYVSDEEFGIGEVQPFENALLFVSNRFYFGDDKHVFEPFVLYRYSDVLPPQLEVSAAIHLNHVVWFGGSYKQDFGITGFGGIKVKKLFGIGYAYSLKNTGLNELNSPTHEIQLNFLFGSQKKERPYYSFIDTSKPVVKSKRQLAIESRKEAEALKKEEQRRKEKEVEEAREEEQRKKIAEEKERAELKQIEERNREEELNKQNNQQQNPTKNYIDDQFTDERVVVKSGGHLLELGTGEFVVVGAFSNYENAETYSDELFFKGYPTRFGYISQQGYWYVYIYKGDNIDTARQERDKYRKMKLFKKAWVISVQ